MSISIRILGWKSNGLRCPDHEISFRKGNKTSVYPISMLQMPNGTGKTTTLDLLKAALSGSALDWSSEQIAGFQKKSGTNHIGRFKLSLLVGDKLVTIELIFDFHRNKVKYSTTTGASGGHRDGFYPPTKALGFFNKELVNLYVFDGELAKKLLNSDETHAESAIDSLYQISQLTALNNHFGKYWETQRNTVGASEPTGYTRRKNRVDLLRQTLQKRKKEKDALNDKATSLKKEIHQLEKTCEALRNKDKALNEQYTKAETALQNVKVRLTAAIKEAVSHVRSPECVSEFFSSELLRFKVALDKLKLPSSTSQEFFKELLEENLCVCDREMDNNAKKAISKNAKKYLAQSQWGVINEIKTQVGNYCTEKDAQESRKRYQNQLKAVSELVRERDECNDEFLRIESKFLDRGDKKLEESVKLLDEKKVEFDRAQTRLTELNANIDRSGNENSVSIATLEFLLEDAEDDLATITKTLEIRNGVREIQKILEIAAEVARKKSQKRIIKETNLQLKRLLSRNPITVEGINCSIQIGQAGASEGQTLAVGYAFMSALFRQDNHRVPFIMDSPALPLDLNVRPEAARIIPQLSEQVILFVISAERQKFIDEIAKSKGDEIQYYTLFRRSKETTELEKRARKYNAQLSDDGAVLLNEDFFNSFDLEQESP